MKKFLIMATTVAAASLSWAQSIPATRELEKIASSAGYNFVYPSGLLDGIKVNAPEATAPLEAKLEAMFSGTGIVWKIQNRNIILKKSPAKSVYTLSGFVREVTTSEPLVGAIVRTAGTGAVTNTMGFYSLTVPSGHITATVSYPGFTADTLRMDIAGDMHRDFALAEAPVMLNELVVTDNPNRSLALEAPAIGTLKVSNAAILATPVLFGESDIIKTLQLEPGVSAGVEGMAGMYVHGGNVDENLYMLDNIPLYQINHFGGLFSAFNTEALRNVDFYKSSFPARYDGRLSSFMDVNTKDGSTTAHHGSVKLGLTSGAFNIDGPLRKGTTTYSFAIRRSWYDLLTLPVCAIVNSASDDSKYNMGYAFMDINAKVTHRFSPRSKVYAMFYYGDDYLHVKQSDTTDPDKNINHYYYDNTDRNHLRWGNIIGSLGWNYVLSPKVFGEFTAAFSRYSSKLESEKHYIERSDISPETFTRDNLLTHNNINDWILKADFDWHPHNAHRLNFGAGVTYHSFLPTRTTRTLETEKLLTTVNDRVTAYHAVEGNAYFGGDWNPWRPLRINYGVHASLFNIESKTHTHLSPRLSARWKVNADWTVKAGYAHTVQYVHQLLQSSISLPTDQWVPVTGDQSPQTADKISAGVYRALGRDYTLSVEGYWKWMDNLMEYADAYYLLPPDTGWSSKLTPGTGTAKGLDFKLAREYGKFTGHIAYSLMWADRQYENKNHGKRFPARFDNRHKINIVANWKINAKWEMSAAWTGMSGNRFTLPTQIWTDPMLGPWHYDMLLETEVNNYRLPFYHRLDLSFRRNTRRGYWTFALYNAYCNMNTIAVRRDYSSSYDYNPETGQFTLNPVFQKIKLIPVIPSVSYTWLF